MVICYIVKWINNEYGVMYFDRLEDAILFFNNKIRTTYNELKYIALYKMNGLKETLLITYDKSDE